MAASAIGKRAEKLRDFDVGLWGDLRGPPFVLRVLLAAEGYSRVCADMLGR